MFDFKIVTSWIENLLRVELGLDNFWTLAIEFVLVGVALLAAYALIALVLIYAERKICAFFQCRIGPDRVGKWGLIQVIADMIKILTKEIIPIKRKTSVFLSAILRYHRLIPDIRSTSFRKGASRNRLQHRSIVHSCRFIARCYWNRAGWMVKQQQILSHRRYACGSTAHKLRDFSWTRIDDNGCAGRLYAIVDNR